MKEFGRGVGFAAQNRTDDNEHSRSVIQKALNKTFAPEFLNRLDEIITFDQLSLEAITKIVDIELKGLYERVEAIGYKLVVEDDAKTFLASKGYDVQFGARPLKRAIQNHLEDGLSELIVFFIKTVKMSVLMGWHFFCAISAGIIKNINLKNINVVCKKVILG